MKKSQVRNNKESNINCRTGRRGTKLIKSESYYGGQSRMRTKKERRWENEHERDEIRNEMKEVDGILLHTPNELFSVFV
jgi:hypothetical protein